MSSTSTQIVPYSSSSIPQWCHDVFLSFRGQDTRYNFTDHLYNNLIQKGIRTFRDDFLKRGEEIAPELLKAIQESRFSIVVFSENYAHSRWCLDELAKIMDCRKEKGQTVIPVFYHVDPSHVRKQTGSFGEAFSKYEEDTEEKKQKVRRWRSALTGAANLSGELVKENMGYESDSIKRIIEIIFNTLNREPLDLNENIVGADLHFIEMAYRLHVNSNDVRMVGIYGCGGIGKTTIAKVVYNRIFHKYDSISFLENVRETSINHHGLVKLQKKLLNDILAEGNHNIGNVDQGKKMIQDNLKHKRVLIVLDDVDNMWQLESLAGSKQWFGQGSRIIITTRDKHLLVFHGVDEYQVKGLNFEEAIQLFSWNAFKQNHPKQEYKCLSIYMVDYAKGLPLALKILGSFLYGKTRLEWQSELGKLKTTPNMEIQGVLRRSYDGLEYLQKEIFLDIACFFRGKHRDFVLRILDGCNLHATSGIRVLSDRCLISVSHDNKIHMHDLIQQMGWDIVREKYRTNPNRWRRLWDPKDISCALARRKGIRKVEAIFLDLSKSKEIQFNSSVWTKMKKLRLLKVYWSNVQEHKNKDCLPRDFEFSWHELVYLHWEGFSLTSLPSNFHGENLVEINLSGSKIQNLWQVNKRLQKLKVLNLSGCNELAEIPHLSSMPNLEELTLQSCYSLEKLDPSIGELNKLVLLNLSWCRKLRSLPSSIEHLYSLKHLYLHFCQNLEKCLAINICKLRSLVMLNLYGCSNLDAFPKIEKNMECLEGLNLSETCIGELPSSIEHLNLLRYLNLRHCKNLRSLPGSVCKLKFLKELNLYECSNLEAFPEIKEDMESLEMLDLSGTGITELPSSVQHLIRLQELYLIDCENLVTLPSSIHSLRSLQFLLLNGCSKLEKFPRNPGSLESLRSLMELDLSHCYSLEGAVPTDISQFCKLKTLNISHCKLEGIQELPSSLRRIDAHDCTGLETLISSPSSVIWTHLLKWFKSATEEDVKCGIDDNKITRINEVILGARGIPGWVSHQKMGNQVQIKLPMNWYEDNHFFGFAFFCLYHPRIDKLGCELIMHSNSNQVSVDCIELLCPSCENCMINGGGSDRLYTVFYPEIHIPDKYRCNQFTDVEVSFQVFSTFDGPDDHDNDETVNSIKYCGVHLIYFQNHRQSDILFEFLGTQGNDGKLFLNLFPEKFGDLESRGETTNVKRSRGNGEQNQAVQPHQKRLKAVNTNLKL